MKCYKEIMVFYLGRWLYRRRVIHTSEHLWDLLYKPCKKITKTVCIRILLLPLWSLCEAERYIVGMNLTMGWKFVLGPHLAEMSALCASHMSTWVLISVPERPSSLCRLRHLEVGKLWGYLVWSNCSNKHDWSTWTISMALWRYSESWGPIWELLEFQFLWHKNGRI